MKRIQQKGELINMNYFLATDENIKIELGAALLCGHEWVICVTAKDSSDLSTYVLENVTRYENDGYFASIMMNPVFIEYGISPAKNGSQYPYRIHDSLMTPVNDIETLTSLIDAMIETFDVFIVEKDMIDRCNVYGKLFTDYEDEVVFVNKFDDLSQI